MNTQLLLSPLLAVATAWPVMAQPQAGDPPAHHAQAVAAVAAAMAEGEIRRIDKSANKITIKHGEIANLDMPPMTMVFQVKDPNLLDRVKVGDKVRFTAEKNAAGAFVVSDIQPAP